MDGKMPAKDVGRDGSDDERKEEDDGEEENTNCNASNEDASEKENDTNCDAALLSNLSASNDAAVTEPRRTSSHAASSLAATASRERDPGEATAALTASAGDRTALSLRTIGGRTMTLPAPDAVKMDALALLLVERTGVPGAYQSRPRETNMPQVPSGVEGGEVAAATVRLPTNDAPDRPQADGDASDQNAPQFAALCVNGEVAEGGFSDQSGGNDGTGRSRPSDEADNSSQDGRRFPDEVNVASLTAARDDYYDSSLLDDAVITIDAYVAPSELVPPAGSERQRRVSESALNANEELSADQEAQQRRLNFIEEQIREHLSRNAPLVEATVAQDEEGTERRDVSVGIETAPMPSSSRERGESTRTKPVPPIRWRVMSLVAVAAIAAAIVAAVVVTRKDDYDGPSPEGSDSSLPYPSAMPSMIPSHIPLAAPASQSSTIDHVEESEDFYKLRDVVSAISSGESLADSLSPQYRALSWLVHDDEMNLTAYEYDTEQMIQRYIAATLLFSTGDSESLPLDEIMVGSECTWNNALSEGATAPGVPGGIACSDEGKVMTIKFGLLSFRPIVGSLPNEIGHLPCLQQILFQENPGLMGTIPKSIAMLQELKRLIIRRPSGTGLRGTIPSFTSASIREIIIRGASLSGPIPPSMGNLTRLLTLVVSNNDITGTVPESIANLKELTLLVMDDNKLTGALPSSLGQNQDDLVLVSFGDNMLNGTIPSGLLSRKNLRGLFLHGNHLSGTIGTEFGDMIALKKLFLNSNFLTSTIPSELGNLVSLESLELGNNLLNGTVPIAFQNLANLESLSLAENSDLSGELNFLCNMSLANLLTDCDVSNPKLDCNCCECCQSSLHTCGVLPDGNVALLNFVMAECCQEKQCGKSDCTGDYPIDRL